MTDVAIPTEPVLLSAPLKLEQEGKEEQLQRLLKTPGFGGFQSAHTLINRERSKRARASLKRSRALDEICRAHAQKMASEQALSHSVSSTQELRQLVESDYVGENVQRGLSVPEMHQQAMVPGTSTFRNILRKDFIEFGVATSKGKDGKLYMVQLFRGASTCSSSSC